MSRKSKVIRTSAIAIVGLLVAIQALPYGRNRTNPPTTGSPKWDSPKTEELARRACFNCHSNETEWPWYSRLAPISWRVVDHVMEGREHLNFSEWDKTQRHADEAAHEVEEGAMPLRDYLLLHPEARLSDAEKAELIHGLETTFPPRERNR